MKPVKSDVSFPKLEEQVLQKWTQEAIIEKGLALHENKKPFVFYDGPPFATGTPHYGHILAGTLKDIVPRYWAMKGHYVERRWGWDCHGLPVEYEMEKELNLQGRHDIEQYGIAKFNEACRSIVLRYTQEWEKTITRTGRWADFKHTYRTMDPSFMETVWWVFKQLWDKGLIFEGYRVMPYSWRISTPLSNFEANLNYKTVQNPAVTVRLKSKQHDRYLLAWTTTPWTLPSNLALAVNTEMNYVEIQDAKANARYLLAEARLSHYYKKEEDYTIVRSFKGQELVGETYEPIFDYFKDDPETKNAYRVVAGHHVTETDGTGIVHVAPAFGEDDMIIGQKEKLGLVNPVDAEGKFDASVPDYQGIQVKEADKAIIKELKANEKLVLHETIQHSYPFCWRSDTPLIYRAISTWFLKIDPIKQAIIDNNKTTHWVPEHLRDGRFGKWLENARDWNISRNRFWGTPLPIWRCVDKACDHQVCLGSVEELSHKSKIDRSELTDLHKHFVDEIELDCEKCGKSKSMRRIEEVLDCWFESGSMPYGKAHYPFENKAYFDDNFPADFIAEGLDQTRGWFYTLSVLGTALFGKAPFKNVIVNGLILAEDGKKMSKREKNYPDPNYLLDTYGADALRAYLTTSPASHAEELRFSEKGVKEVIRAVLLPLWNAYSFFVTYALADQWDGKQEVALDKLDNELDQWIVSKLQTLVSEVESKMAIYHLHEVIPIVLNFTDDLTNWYIRLNRRRFWKEGNSTDKNTAYTTLYYVLTEFCKVLAPILPFITEEMYQNLRKEDGEESIHFCAYPTPKKEWIRSELEDQMALLRTVVSMARNCRATHKLKTRQPLKELKIITKNPKDKTTIEQHQALLSQELNIKNISFSSDETKWVTLSAKPNAKALGPRLGKQMKNFMKSVRSLAPEKVTSLVTELETKGEVEFEGQRLTPEDLIIDRQPKQSGLIQTAQGVTVWIDSNLDEALIAEGRAREFVNRIQKLRKDIGLEVTDRIRIQYECPKPLAGAVTTHRTYIMTETLAEAFESTDPTGAQWTSEQTIDDFSVKVRIERA